jgi:Uma2 family endonuclease
MSTVALKPLTATEFAALDIDEPVELVRGEVIEMPRPGMRHGVIANNVGFLLTSWMRADEAHAGFVVADAGILTEHDPDTVRGPDVYYLSRARLPGGVVAGFSAVPPELCVEVISPHDVWKDVISKVDEYLQAGVREVWVIEPDERSVYVYRPDGAPRTLSEDERLTTPVLSDFSVPVAELFRDLPSK